MTKRRIFLWFPTLGACLLVFLVFLQLWQGDGDMGAQANSKGASGFKTILLAGVDAAGENTDMLMLCTLDKATGKVSFMQIPRDTFYRMENSKGKINRIYRSFVSKYGRKHAAEELSKELGSAFGVCVDGCVIFDTKTVSSVVDTVGGVPVNIPNDFTYFDAETGIEKKLSVGEHVLNGEEAVAFLRHRKSYAEGDLGRLDAQMRFFSGLFSVLPSSKNMSTILVLYQKILPNLLTNLTEKDIMEIMIAYLKNRSSYSVSLMRLPGEACYTDGAWYYVPYRGATEAMLQSEHGLAGRFDDGRRFTDASSEVLSNIYFFSDKAYRTYTPEEIANKKVLRG